VVGELAEVEEGGYYAPYLTLASGATVEAAETAFAEEIDRFRTAPVTPAELAEAKNELLSASLRRRETASGRLFELGEGLVRSGNPRTADARISAIKNVTAADVQRVAQTYLAAQSRIDIRYLKENPEEATTAASWRNPEPMPAFQTLPPADRVPLELAAEGQRDLPPEPAAAQAVSPPVITESKLDTGLTVISARTNNVPIASLMMVIKGGSSTDPAGKAGLANLAAELATKGTNSRTAQQIAAQMESLGATMETTAGQDGLVISISAPTANLEAAGRILADIVQNASFPEEEVERERSQALDLLQITFKNPAALANVLTLPLLYGGAPYGAVPIGTPASLNVITRDDLRDHYRRWWRPDNATMIVAGGVDERTASRLAALFSGWRGSIDAPPPSERAGTAARPRTVVIDVPGAGQAAVLAAVRAVGRNDPHYFDLLVANAVLGGGSGGRLFDEIRVKRALSYGAYSSMPPRMSDTVLTAAAQTKNETAAQVAQVILDEFDRLGSETFSPEMIEKRKAFLSGGYNRQSETAEGFGFLLANLVIQGAPLGEGVRFSDWIDRVTPEAASAAARDVVRRDAATLVIVGDASKFIDELRGVRPDVELIPVTALNLDAVGIARPSERPPRQRQVEASASARMAAAPDRRMVSVAAPFRDR
jgi:zinc protease